MKLKAADVVQALPVITQIIQENRPMSQKGKYWMARAYAKLLPEFQILDARRQEMIKAYGFQPDPSKPEQFSVPEDQIPDFVRAWGEISSQDVEVNIYPLHLAWIDLGEGVNGSIAAHELAALGDLVSE